VHSGDIVGFAFHIEFAIVFVRDPEPEPLIQPTCRIGLDYSQRYRSSFGSGFNQHSIHDLGADALPLETSFNKQLGNENRITLCHALQPSYINTVQGDYSNLMKVPLISEASGVSGQIQAQFADRSVHFGEV